MASAAQAVHVTITGDTLTRLKTLVAGMLLLAPTLGLSQELKTADEYRAALQDKFANPGNLTVERAGNCSRKNAGPRTPRWRNAISARAQAC